MSQLDGYDLEEENSLRLHPLAGISPDFHTKPHFYKIIIITPHLHKLRIPPFFTKQFKDDLLDHVYLSAPYGETFRVNLTKDDNDAWFDEGWNAFATRYSLRCGYFLVFRLEGDSRFRVFIFDITATEIEYSQATIEEAPETGSNLPVEENAGRGGFAAFQRAAEFKCGNPNFLIRMTKTSVAYSTGHYNRLSIPSKFVQLHMRKKPKVVHLGTAGKQHKSWAVNFYHCKGQPARLTAGWMEFARDNGLKEGDVCVFELTSERSNRYLVHIFPA